VLVGRVGLDPRPRIIVLALTAELPPGSDASLSAQSQAWVDSIMSTKMKHTVKEGL